MAGAAFAVKRFESDTLQGLADLMEAMLNDDYVVDVEAAFPPTLALSRGKHRNIAGHVLLYGTEVV